MKESQTAVERITLGVLIASDKGANGQRQDSCLPVIRQKLSAIGCIVSNYSILPDERPFLAATLREWADKERGSYHYRRRRWLQSTRCNA